MPRPLPTVCIQSREPSAYLPANCCSVRPLYRSDAISVSCAAAPLSRLGKIAKPRSSAPVAPKACACGPNFRLPGLLLRSPRVLPPPAGAVPAGASPPPSARRAAAAGHVLRKPFDAGLGLVDRGIDGFETGGEGREQRR